MSSPCRRGGARSCELRLRGRATLPTDDVVDGLGGRHRLRAAFVLKLASDDGDPMKAAQSFADDFGLNAIQALRLVGADPIVAVDANPEKEALARQFGATHFVDASAGHVVEAVQDITRGGADWAFECVGNKAAMEQALAQLQAQGSFITSLLPAAPTTGTT